MSENHYFLVGDHRRASKDSRHFGPVHRDRIHGSAEYLYWATDDLSRLGPLD